MFTKVIIEHNFHENKTEIVYKAKTFKELWDISIIITDGISRRFVFLYNFLKLLKFTGTLKHYLNWILKREYFAGNLDEWEYESLTGKAAPEIKKRISTSSKVGICYTHYNHKINFITFGKDKKKLSDVCYMSNALGSIYVVNKKLFYCLKSLGLLWIYLEIQARLWAFEQNISVYELKGYKRPSSKQEV